MLKAFFTEKRIKKSWGIIRLKRLLNNQKLNLKSSENAENHRKKLIKKLAFKSLLYKQGTQEREKILMKKSFFHIKNFGKTMRKKLENREFVQENYKYRLQKLTFWRWRVFRVKRLRRRKQMVKFI